MKSVVQNIQNIWFETDVLIIGGGAAATMAAFECAEAGVRSIQVTKGKATSGTTTVARGGFAAAMGKGDSPELHLKDILQHGGELIDPKLAEVWCWDIIDIVNDMESWGSQFIRNDKGDLDLKSFPGHSQARGVHHYDTTGNMVTKTLSKKLRSNNNIKKHSLTSIVDLIKEGERVIGAWGVEYGSGKLVSYAAKEVILCTGGGSGLFYVNDNPPQVTGDGYVLGYRAGSPLVGIEMIDFQAMCCSPKELFGFAPHPTGFVNVGAVFKNQDGEEFLKRYYPDTAEQSSRAEVILAMAREIHAGRAGLTGGIFMDATHVPLEKIKKAIPHVYKTCLHRGIDITKVPLEVAPGSHTWLGGLKIDINGKTRVDGLWAAGETGGGIHGGNRIGGSALSAALVFGRRAGKAASTLAMNGDAPSPVHIPENAVDWLSELIARNDGPYQTDVRLNCQMLAHEKLGSIRTKEQCENAIREFERIEKEEVPTMRLADAAGSSEKILGEELESALSIKNLSLLGRLLGTAALNREESRGTHFRLDYQEVDDENWRAVTHLEQDSKGGIIFNAISVK
jgi:succinate dehydrogenase/fumarate reductase flavoprotein subunit